MKRTIVLPMFAMLCLQYGAYAARFRSQASLHESANGTSEQTLDGRKPIMQVRIDMMRTRQCIQEKVTKFPEMMQRFGRWMPDPARDVSLLNLVVAKWIAQDLMENHLGNYNALKKLISKWRSPQMKLWYDELANISKQIADLGFNYAATERSCKKGWTEDVQDCLALKAEKFEESFPDWKKEGFPLTNWTNTVLFYEEIKIHSRTAQISIPPLRDLYSLIRSSGFPYRKMQRVCKTESDHDAQELIAFLDEDVARTNRDTQHCAEVPENGFCPEGLAPKVARPIDVRKASAAASLAYAGSGPVLSGFLAVAGSVTGGWAGAASGAVQGMLMASTMHLGPILAGLAYVVFGTGSRACMCFPRECTFDAEADACVMSFSDIPSLNPYGRSLPFMSQKCVPRRNKTGSCEIQTCDAVDFETELGTVEREYNGTALSATLYGKVGRQIDGGIYNCMSSSGLAGDSLLLQTKIAGTQVENTAMSRAEIFAGFGVTEKMDSSASE